MNDKLLHFLAGFSIAIISSIVFSPTAGFLLAVLAGAAKELYDYFNPAKHTVEFLDFLYTIAGGFAAAILSRILWT